MKVNKNKLYLAMARACMTTADLTEKTGMPRPTLNNIIVGRNAMPANVGRIAKALGCDVTDIMEDEEQEA